MAYGGTLLLVILVLGGIVSQKIYTFASAISPQSPLSSQLHFAGANRLNLLVLVHDGGDAPGADITDSMVIISLQEQTGKTALISVPRDFGIHLPVSTKLYFKIDTAYEYGLALGDGKKGPGKVAGGDLAARQITRVTGLNVTYWMTLDVQGFRQLVDELGGVDIDIPCAFTALDTVHFSAGWQHMDGERAMNYARERQVLDNPAEDSDFARSARQRQLIEAIVARMNQVSTWPNFLSVLDSLQNSIYTNLSARDLFAFVRTMDRTHAQSIGLTTQNVLHSAVVGGGLQILLPKNGDDGLVRQYIQQQLDNDSDVQINSAC
ncbi:MAG TPA: LCP family protein [Ktedonobacteraceae bacterium]|jgi:LCP family protein required for cell wall assembly